MWAQGVYFNSCFISRLNHERQFADLSEYGYGVAFLSESKYGFACEGNVLRISLLRAATAPDAEQDQGPSRVLTFFTLRCSDVTFCFRQARVLVGSHGSRRLFPGIRRSDGRLYL